MSYNTHRSAPTYCTDFGSSIRTFGSRSEMMMLFSTLRSGAWAAKATQPIPKKIEIVIRLSTESNDLLESSSRDHHAIKVRDGEGAIQFLIRLRRIDRSVERC